MFLVRYTLKKSTGVYCVPLLSEAQRETATLDNTLVTARESATTLRQALENNTETATSQHRRNLKRNVDNLALGVGATVGVVQDIQNTIGAETSSGQTDAILDLLADIQSNTDAMQESENEESAVQRETETVKTLEDDLTELETLLTEFQNINPQILVSPFRSETTNITTTQLRPSDFFAPAVIVLLLQHLAVTFGALSIVKERQIGTIELFRVSPISPFETIIGKYLSYLLFAVVLTSILTLIVIFGLGVPMQGNWIHFSLSLTALLFASLGFGFVISLLAKTDSAAVQYSMIMLLASVFFSGAFIGLHTLWQPGEGCFLDIASYLRNLIFTKYNAARLLC